MGSASFRSDHVAGAQAARQRKRVKAYRVMRRNKRGRARESFAQELKPSGGPGGRARPGRLSAGAHFVFRKRRGPEISDYPQNAV